MQEALADSVLYIRVRPPGAFRATPRSKRFNAWVGDAGVESIEVEHDATDGWRTTFLLDRSGMVTGGRLATIQHGREPAAYGEFHRVVPLGGDWYLSDYVW